MKRGVEISPTSPLPKIMRVMSTSPSSFDKIKWTFPPPLGFFTGFTLKRGISGGM